MKFKQLSIIAVTSAIMAAPTLTIARDHRDRDEVELEEAYLYFELNDTDGDLGLHGKADGDAWKSMSVEGPEGRHERKILSIRARAGMRRQGFTELFFESAEPTFDELDPEVFFPASRKACMNGRAGRSTTMKSRVKSGCRILFLQRPWWLASDQRPKIPVSRSR